LLYDAAFDDDDVRAVRVALPEGGHVCVEVAGRGVPFLFVHGFFASGALYGRLLNGVGGLGFRTIAVDIPGHGESPGLTHNRHDLRAYTRALGSVLDELGVRRAVIAGHSLGGRLAAELAAERPERTLAVLLLGAAVGAPWDRLVSFMRIAPPALGMFGAAFAAELASTVPLSVLLRAARNPWGSAAAGLSLFAAGRSTDALERIRAAGLPVVVAHGTRDALVPFAAARDAAERTGGELVVAEGGSHSWLAHEPSTLRLLVEPLADGPLAFALRDPAGCYAPDSPVYVP
jgi:pimeloyl-ACP methyl ester carboxylesterase